MNPAIAHYLVTMARLLPGEIVLDPLAGPGTIPIEAAVQCRGAVAFGGDLDRSDVSNQSWNFSEGVLPLYLQGYNWCGSGIPFPAHCFLGGRWNAVKIPFRDGTVDAIISDLPFGKRCGNAWTNAKLYPQIFREFWRVLVPGGRVVVLTLENSLMDKAILSMPEWRLDNVPHQIDMTGLYPYVYRLVRVP